MTPQAVLRSWFNVYCMAFYRRLPGKIDEDNDA